MRKSAGLAIAFSFMSFTMRAVASVVASAEVAY